MVYGIKFGTPERNGSKKKKEKKKSGGRKRKKKTHFSQKKGIGLCEKSPIRTHSHNLHFQLTT